MAHQPESGGSPTDENIQRSGNGIELAVPGGNEITIPTAGTELDLTSVPDGSQEAQTEVTVTGGDFRGASLGPKTSKTVVQANRYDNSVINEYHYHYGGGDSQEPSTSGATAPKRPRVEEPEAEEGYTKISEDIFINLREPLRRGVKIFKGYQKHVRGTIPVAIKRIVDCNDTHVREVEHLIKLSTHPNVVRIIQSRERDSDVRILYIVMELCSKKNLQDYMDENRKKKTPFNFKRTMSYSKQLVSGMRHIHRNRIVHRDMKPENVLLSQDEEQVKITDFGLGKELRVGRSITKVTTQGQGTEGYRAPEALNSDKVSRYADVFSLGITLFGLWSDGGHPFGEDIFLRDYNIKNNVGRDFSGLLLFGIKKEEFLDLIDRMLQFDPQLRPSMDEVAEHPFFMSEQVQVPEAEGRNIAGSVADTASEEPASNRQAEEEETIPKESASPSDEIEFGARTFFAPEEEASRLLKEHKFEEAILVLADLEPTERQQKILAECYFRVGRDTDALATIGTLKALMISSSGRPKPDDVIKIIEGFIDSSLFLQALILIPCAAELCKVDSTPDESLWGFVLCVWRCSDVIGGLYRQGGRMRVISKTVTFDIIKQILSNLQSVTDASLDRKVDMEARCLNDIASSYYSIENYNEAIEYFHKGIGNMRSHFGSSASKYSVLERLHHNLAGAQYKLGNYHEAEKNFVESLRVTEAAEDYPNEAERKKSLECGKANLKRFRIKMKQAQNG